MKVLLILKYGRNTPNAVRTTPVDRALWTTLLFFVFRGTCNMRDTTRRDRHQAICTRLASRAQTV